MRSKYHGSKRAASHKDPLSVKKDHYRRLGAVVFIQVYMLFAGFVCLGAMVAGAFSLLQIIIFMPFMTYGIISSSRWLLRHKEDVWELQTIISKKIGRRFRRISSLFLFGVCVAFMAAGIFSACIPGGCFLYVITK